MTEFDLNDKRAWAKNRHPDRRLKDGTIEERKVAADVARAIRHRSTDAPRKKVCWWREVLRRAGFLAILLICSNVYGKDKCEDPGLAPNLKKACYQMEAMCKQIGCSVSVR